jgi:hypothetical protein
MNGCAGERPVIIRWFALMFSLGAWVGEVDPENETVG